MHLMRSRVLILSAALVAMFALPALVIAPANLGGEKTALAVDPTPKPGTTGNLSGIFDVQLLIGTDKATSLYTCMTRMDHDGTSNAVKWAAQCYTDVDIGDPSAEPPDLPGEGAGDLLPGPPPPPTYDDAGSRTKLYGSFAG